MLNNLTQSPWRLWGVLLLLASQYLLVNLFTAPLFGDAPRNLHWGRLVAEQPDFLIGSHDSYHRVNGFPMGEPTEPGTPEWEQRGDTLHRWWGPLVLLTWALIWKLTNSLLLAQLVVPLATGATVIVTFLFARDLLGPNRALVAAAFLAWFPIFREFGSSSYIETFSALMLTSALFAYWRGNLWAVAILAGLAGITKMDLLPLYLLSVATCTAAFWWAQRQHLPLMAPISRQPWRYHLLALLLPILLAGPWFWFHHLRGGDGDPTGGVSFAQFLELIPQMVALLFYTPWFVGLVVLVIIAIPAWHAIQQRQFDLVTLALFGGWLGGGLLILLVYAAADGAGNSPRIIIPSLPALAILFAGGITLLAQAWQRRIGFLLFALFTGVNLMLIGLYADQTAQRQSYMQAWNALRERPHGFVLTSFYWETLLYTNQPVTWFWTNEALQQAALGSADGIQSYVERAPIRYVLVREGDEFFAAEALRGLDQTATREQFGEVVLYTIQK